VITSRRIIAFLILGAFFSCFIFFVVAPKRPLNNPDGCDYLQMALNLANGKGFHSTQIFVHHAYWFSRHGVDLHNDSTVPMLYRFPLPVIIEALFLRIGFSPYVAAQLYSTLGYLLSGLILFLIILRFSDSCGVSLALVSAFLLSGSTLEFAIGGLTEPLATFFFLLLLIVLVSPIPLFARTTVGALLCGLAFLNRTPSIFIMLPLLFLEILICQGNNKLTIKHIIFLFLGLLGVFTLVISPWLYRSQAITGNLLFNFTNAVNLLNGLEKLCSYTTFYSMSAFDFIISNLSHITRKILSNMISALFNLRTLLNINKLILLPFLLGLALIIYGRSKFLLDLNVAWLRRVVILWGAAFFFNLAGQSLAWGQLDRFYAPLWPMVLVLAFTGSYFLMKHILGLSRYLKDRMSNTTTKSLAGIITGILYLILNPPILHPLESFLFSRPRETIQAVRESKAFLCGREMDGALISDVSDVFSVELHGCNLLMCRYEFDSNLLESSSLNEWDKFVNVVGIFISRKGWDHMDQEDKKILGEKEKTYPRIINFSDGSRLYLR
jgi:hypothetical protein